MNRRQNPVAHHALPAAPSSPQAGSRNPSPRYQSPVGSRSHTPTDPAGRRPGPAAAGAANGGGLPGRSSPYSRFNPTAFVYDRQDRLQMAREVRRARFPSRLSRPRHPLFQHTSLVAHSFDHTTLPGSCNFFVRVVLLWMNPNLLAAAHVRSD